MDCIKEALDNYIEPVQTQPTSSENVNYELIHDCGVEMVKFKEASNMIDLFINDIPYILSAEKYTDDPRDLCNIKDLDGFYERVEVMMKNMKRLIKTSNYEEGVIKPIIMKVGSQRRGNKGLMTMDTDIEMIARKIGLTLHDKIFNELKPAMQSYLINTSFQKRFTLKLHETNLVFLDYG